jgi:hypothetical protein
LQGCKHRWTRPTLTNGQSPKWRRFNQAVENRDPPELERVLADPFTWIHALDGRLESRSTFIVNVVNGQGLARQRADSSTTLIEQSQYGHPAIATSRVRTR